MSGPDLPFAGHPGTTPDGRDPLIITLTIDPESQERFDVLRREHFPVARNHLHAHVTLFHALPGAQIDAVKEATAESARRDAFDVAVTGVHLLGRGVAYDLTSPALSRLRGDLAAGWATWLTRQDRQRYRPHITVQNKVSPAQARELQAALAATFEPFAVQAAGLAVWHYLGGPWRLETVFPFRAD